MEFANREYFLLLLLIIPYVIWYVMFRKKSEPTIRMADTFAFRYAPRSWKVLFMPVQLVLRLLAFTLLVVSLPIYLLYELSILIVKRTNVQPTKE